MNLLLKRNKEKDKSDLNFVVLHTTKYKVLLTQFESHTDEHARFVKSGNLCFSISNWTITPQKQPETFYVQKEKVQLITVE